MLNISEHRAATAKYTAKASLALTCVIQISWIHIYSGRPKLILNWPDKWVNLGITINFYQFTWCDARIRTNSRSKAVGFAVFSYLYLCGACRTRILLFIILHHLINVVWRNPSFFLGLHMYTASKTRESHDLIHCTAMNIGIMITRFRFHVVDSFARFHIIGIGYTQRLLSKWWNQNWKICWRIDYNRDRFLHLWFIVAFLLFFRWLWRHLNR